MSPGIGIDLGTTNCVVAVYKEDEYGGGADVVQNDIGSRSTPSVVAILEAERLVGEAAVLQAPMNPANTIRNVKRVLGESFRYAIEEKNHFGAVNLVKDETRDAVSFRVDHRDFAPEEVLAMILKPLFEAAQLQLGGDEARLVIAVPSYFTYPQRIATTDAATIAGWEGVSLVNETTAAALTYASIREAALKAILIDIGGGGTSLSVVETHPDGGVEVLATSGLRLPGGDEMDSLMIQHLAQKISEKYQKNVCKDPRAFEILRKSWQDAKIKLSRLPQTKIDTFLPGVDIHLQEVVDIEEFKSVCSDSFSKAFKDMLDHILEEAKVTREGINDVVLVGRASRTPWLRSLLQEMLECPTPCRGINPDEAVACGAALYAALPARLRREVNPHAFAVRLDDEKEFEIRKKNKTVPHQMELDFDSPLPTFRIYELDGLRKYRIATIEVPNVLLPYKMTIDFEQDGLVLLRSPSEEIPRCRASSRCLASSRVHDLQKQAEEYLNREKAHNAKLEAKNALENVCRELKHKVITVEDESKKSFCLSFVENALDWLKANESASADEFLCRYETVKVYLDEILEGIRAVADNKRRQEDEQQPHPNLSHEQVEHHRHLNQQVDPNAGQGEDHRSLDQEGKRQEPHSSWSRKHQSGTNVGQDEGRRSPPQQHPGPSSDAPHPSRGGRASPSRGYWVKVDKAEEQELGRLAEWGTSAILLPSRDGSSSREPKSAPSSSGGTCAKHPSPTSHDVRMDFQDGEQPSPAAREDEDAALQCSLKELHLHVLRSELSRDGGSETGLVFMPVELLEHHNIALTSLAAELRRVAVKEVRAAGCAALLVDTIQHYTSMMLRYVQGSGAIVERLIALLPKRLATAQHLMTALKEFFNEVEMDWKKVVKSLSMDAPASMTREYHVFQRLMREERGPARGVRLVWNSSHQLDDFIAQTCCAKYEALAIFFGKLEALREFFLPPERFSWLVGNCVAVDEDTFDCYENLVSFVLSNWKNIVEGLKFFLPRSDPQTVFLIHNLVDAVSDDFLLLCLHFNHIFTGTRQFSELLLNACDCEEALQKALTRMNKLIEASYNIDLTKEAFKAGIQVHRYVRVYPLEDAVHAVRSALTDPRLKTAVEALSRMSRVHRFIEAISQPTKKPRMTDIVLSIEADELLDAAARRIQPSDSASDTVLHLMQFQERGYYRKAAGALYDPVQKLCTLPLIPATGGVRKLATLRDRLRYRTRMGMEVLEAIMVIVCACDDVSSPEKALLKDYSSVTRHFKDGCACMHS